MRREEQADKSARPAPSAPAAHGGDLARARALYGGAAAAWLDLSTGINAEPYPLRPLDAASPIWRRLPDADLTAEAAEAARAAYGAPQAAAILPCPGAQGAIQALPRLLAPGRVAVLSPTYAEHARAFVAAGWRVEPVSDLGAAEGADAAVVTHPNNPDGRRYASADLLRLADRVGLLILDESFMDETPEASLAGFCGGEGLVALRSLGKFFGLAGLRLGFAVSGPALGEKLAAALGPWPVSGPALHLGAEALRDGAWAAATRRRLAEDGPRLRALGAAAGLEPLGGTGLFQTFRASDAPALQAALARRRIWTRIFAEHPGWIRFGAPPAADWERLADALGGVR